MNILIITTSFPCAKTNTIGGKFVLHEALAYARNGANVKVVTPIFEGAPAYEKIENNLEVFRFKYFWPKKFQKIIDPVNPIYHNKNKIIKAVNTPFFIIAFLWAVFKHSHKINIVHCQWTTSVLFAVPFRWLRKYKIVTTARGSDIRVFPKWLNRFIMRKVDAVADCFHSTSFSEEMRKEFPGKYIKLPIIIDTQTNNVAINSLSNPNELRLLYLGRLDPLKIELHDMPILELIDAVKIFKKKNNNIKLAYIGFGDENLIQEIEKKTKELGLEENILMLGPKNTPQNYFCNFDIGIGGISINAVAQEFAMHGLPQIILDYETNFGTEWRHMGNCIMVKPKNTEDLAEKLAYIHLNKNELPQIAENAKTYLSRYVKDLSNGGKDYIIAFRNLINNTTNNE